MLPFAMYFYHDLWTISIREYIVDSFSKTFRDAVLEMFHTCVNVWIQVFITWALNVMILGFNEIKYVNK